MEKLAQYYKKHALLTELILFGIIFAVFIFVRIIPLLDKALPYTYDQGRDFLKAYDIVKHHEITFIGPTTGINGLFHGAWWFYVVSVAFVLFKGWPLGFYIFNFIIQTATSIVFIAFIRKYFGLLNTIIVALLLTLSDYFIGMSHFVGNNSMILPVLVAFIIVHFYLLEEKTKYVTLFTFMAGVLLSLMLEFEVAFGMFLIPAYILLGLFLPRLRTILFNFINGPLFIFGFCLGSITRILFEVRHDFLQTKTILGFFIKPKLYNPKPFYLIIVDRVVTFASYYLSLFPYWIVAVAFLLGIMTLFFISRKKKNIYENSTLFFGWLLFLLFFLSLFYKDNFWSNYYEGILYLFLVFISFIIVKATDTVSKKIKYLGVIILLISSIVLIYTTITIKPKDDGLKVQTAVMNYIFSHQDTHKDYCLRIYTPPVIPYTYNYLLQYDQMKHNSVLPRTDWVNNTCWFIVEPDMYTIRRTSWMKSNIPQDKQPKVKARIYNVDIFEYEEK